MKGIVSFYEKPGCLGNKEQKEKLLEAGYKLQVINILEKEWDEESLLNFFSPGSVHDCINGTAPLIKEGKVSPEELSEEELLAWMVKEPILIKRPLLFFRGKFVCGFNNDLVKELLGAEQEDTRCKRESSGEKCL